MKLIKIIIKKKYQADPTDESESLSYKSRIKVKKVLADLNYYIIFNIPAWYCYHCNVLLHNKPPLSLSLFLPVIKPGHFRSIYDFEHFCQHWKADADADSTW